MNERPEAGGYRETADWHDSQSGVVCYGYDDGCEAHTEETETRWIENTAHFHSALTGPFRADDPGCSAPL